jgi:hypothetical protein
LILSGEMSNVAARLSPYSEPGWNTSRGCYRM